MQQTVWASILALVIYLSSSLGGGNTTTPSKPGQTPTPPPAASTGTRLQYGTISRDSATLRSSPSTAGRKIATLSGGTEFRIMGTSGEWYNVALSSGTTGWVAKWLVKSIAGPSSYKSGRTEVIGYYVENRPGDTASMNTLRAHSQTITTAVPFFYSVDASGRISGRHNQEPIKLSKSRGLKALASVHNIKGSQFDADVTHRLLRSSSARRTAIANMEALLKKYGYDGVNIDFESVKPTDRPYLTQFFKELAWALRPKGYLVTAAVPAKTSDSKSNRWSGAYDYAAIAPYLDYVVLMTYDEHYVNGPAGPVASIGWVRNVLKYATSVMPREKVVMGLAGYGYEWNSKGARAVTFPQVSSIVKQYGVTPKWSNSAQSPYFTYRKNGRVYTVWYENNYSIAAKLKLVREFGLRGVALWRMGIEDPAMWKRIQTGL